MRCEAENRADRRRRTGRLFTLLTKELNMPVVFQFTCVFGASRKSSVSCIKTYKPLQAGLSRSFENDLCLRSLLVGFFDWNSAACPNAQPLRISKTTTGRSEPTQKRVTIELIGISTRRREQKGESESMRLTISDLIIFCLRVVSWRVLETRQDYQSSGVPHHLANQVLVLKACIHIHKDENTMGVRWYT